MARSVSVVFFMLWAVKQNRPINNRVGFSVSIFLGNRKTERKKKKSVFSRENPTKIDRKKQFFSVFGSQPCSLVTHAQKGCVGVLAFNLVPRL